MHSIVPAASPEAKALAHLWWWMVGVGSGVWVVVVAATIYAVLAKRRDTTDDVTPVPPAVHSRMQRAVGAAGFATILVLFMFLAYDFAAGRALAQHPRLGLTVDVTGYQWWWKFEYEDPDPSKRVVTANELHVPVGRPVQLKLAANDVIHSFWAPNLNGKRDLIPGYKSSLWFTADRPGVYRGQCAEFCGLQHAKMAFYVVAESPARFAAWLAGQSGNPTPPTDSTLRYGQRVFLSGGCAVCHTIGGTPAQATVGPSLTHLQSRATIAAGTLANTRANLMGWITNPQAIKPGTLMPATGLQAGQLTALVAYLETLK
jgi:cytochrome c oxidase subunit 2